MNIFPNREDMKMLRTTGLAFGVMLLATSVGAQTMSEPKARLHTVVVASWSGMGERVPTSIRVSTMGVDFHDWGSTSAFHERLRIVARKACDSGTMDLSIRLDDHRCAHFALISAVRDVDEPMLTQVAGLSSDFMVADNTR
ncbi:MAG: UrcA family protein [Caulobacteraceae bacterium]